MLASACTTITWHAPNALVVPMKAAPFAARHLRRQYINRGVSDPAIGARSRPGAVWGRSRPGCFADWWTADLCGGLWPDTCSESGPIPTQHVRNECVADPQHRSVGYAVGPMVVLRCTQKLLVRLKQVDDLPAAESTTRLGDWYGNVLQIGRRQMLLFISERSRLPVIIPIREAKRLPTIFPDTVCEMLTIVGVSAAAIAEERLRMVTVAFGRTRNRSLLGTMNDFAFMAHSGNAKREEPESPEALVRFLAQTPILPLDGARPIDLTRALFRD